VPLHQAKSPLDMTGGTLPTTPSDASDELPSTHAPDDDEDGDRSGNTAPMYIPEDDPLKHDPTLGHVDRDSDDNTRVHEEVPGMEPPDAAPTPADLQSSPPERQPPDAAPVPDDIEDDDQPVLYQPMDKSTALSMG
jgi:hypothetical protein